MMALYGKKDQEEHDTLDPIFGSLSEEQDLPKYQLNEPPRGTQDCLSGN